MAKRTDHLLLYIVSGTKSEAVKIAKTLLKERLIACANIIGPIRSLFQWKGKMEDETEFLLLCKTTKSTVAAAKKLILSVHSYECPCISVLPIIDGHAPFLDWVKNSVS